MKASDFLALASLKRGTVEVNGQTIHVREMSVGERSEFLTLFDKTPALAPAFLARCCVVNEDGTQMFSEKDAEALAASSAVVLDKVAAEVMKLSRLSDDESPNA